MARNSERVVNSANIAASSRLGGPGTPGYTSTQQEGASKSVLGGGTTFLFMGRRTPLGLLERSGTEVLEIIVALDTGTDGETSKASIVRTMAGKYAVAQEVFGDQQIMNLDEYGNKATTVILDGATAELFYSPVRDELRVNPGAIGDRTDISLTINP